MQRERGVSGRNGPLLSVDGDHHRQEEPAVLPLVPVHADDHFDLRDVRGGDGHGQLGEFALARIVAHGQTGQLD